MILLQQFLVSQYRGGILLNFGKSPEWKRFMNERRLRFPGEYFVSQY